MTNTKLTIPRISEDREPLELGYFIGRTLIISLPVSFKCKCAYYTSHLPHHTQTMKTYLRKHLFRNVYSNFIHIAKNWRKHKCPSTGEQKNYSLSI